MGEPLALVVAESAAQAGDAAALISVEIDALPCVINVEEAVLPGAQVIWPAASDNVAISWSSGDTAEIDATFAEAAHVRRLKLLNSRLFANPIEPRSSISMYHKSTESFEWITPSQGSEYMLRVLADQVFCVPDSKIHIRTYDVGGAFGVKEQPYPENVALLHAARVFERPIKWRGTRAENLLSTIMLATPSWTALLLSVTMVDSWAYARRYPQQWEVISPAMVQTPPYAILAMVCLKYIERRSAIRTSTVL